MTAVQDSRLISGTLCPNLPGIIISKLPGVTGFSFNFSSAASLLAAFTIS